MKNADALDRLRDADWLRRAETQELWGLLDGEGGRTRAVGGIVRDTLLDRPRQNSDIDLATELLPEEVIERATRGGVVVYPTGIAHGTLTLRLGTLVTEVTTLREDMETDGRRAVVRFGTDWAGDAGRRDFTLNALYAGMDGSLFDPLGGLADCLAGRVRFIGDAAARIEEDRLRVYRFFRFSASHGAQTFDAAGLSACRAVADRLQAVSAERVGAEMKRMLALPQVALTLRRMVDTGVLHLSQETLRLLDDFEGRGRRPGLAARLALIIAETGAKPLKAMWRLSNDDIAGAEAILRGATLLREERLYEAAYRFTAALGEAVDVAAVLAGWTESEKAAITEQLQSHDIPRFPLSGDDLVRLGMRPGKALGAELERLEQLWIASGFGLDRSALLSRIYRSSPP